MPIELLSVSGKTTTIGLATLVITPLLTGLALAGCGEGDGSAEVEGAGTGIEKAVFIKKADAVCMKTIKKVGKEAKPFLGELTVRSEEARRAAEKRLLPRILAPALQAELKELRALGIPDGDAEQIEAFLDAIQKVAEMAKTNPHALAPGSKPDLFAAARERGQDYGITFCPYGD
jgi:hypothetical protein